MAELTVTRTLNAPRELVWRVLTEASYFERWLPAKRGTAKTDVRTGGSWQATVVTTEGEEIAVSGPYPEVRAPERMLMEVPGGIITEITLVPAGDDSTQISYSFDVSEDLHGVIEESVDDTLGKVGQILAELTA